MRDKLIELLEKAESAVYWDSSDQSFVNKIADFLISHGVTFADVPDTNVGKWIPVSERLPEPRKGVLVYAPLNRNIFECFMREDGLWEFASYRFDLLKENVTHWMPLPEPPKEGE